MNLLFLHGTYVLLIQYKLNLIGTRVFLLNFFLLCFPHLMLIITPFDPILDLIFSSQDIFLNLKTLDLNNYYLIQQNKPSIIELITNWEYLDNYFSNEIIEISEDSFKHKYHMYIKKHLPYVKDLLK